MSENKQTIPQGDVLLRLPQVLKRVPISRSQLYNLIKRGQFPAPIKIGAKISAWPSSQIDGVFNNWGLNGAVD